MRFSFGSLAGAGRSRLLPAFGVVCAVVIAAVLATLLLSARTNEAASPSTSASVSASATAAPTASPTTTGSPTPVASPGETMIANGFMTPGITTGWKGFTWTGISDSSPIRTPITNILPWSGGYVAMAAYPSNGPTRGLWTSPDGQTWTPVTAIQAPAVFVSAAPAGLVAIAVDPAGPYAPGSVWSSFDGVAWHYAGKSDLPGELISIAGTSAGIVATVDVVTGTGKKATGNYSVMFSTDGVHWTPETIAPDLAWSTVPTVQSNGSRFFLMGGTANALAQDGGQPHIIFASSATPSYVWWSDDGRNWTRSGGTIPGFGESIEFGRDGMLLNTDYGSTPGGVGLARSSDGGKTWIPDDNFGPLGVATCTGECSAGPAGEIVSNGTYFLAVKSGGKNAWISYDGHSWSPIAWGGADPTLGSFLLMPRGVVAAEYGAAK